MYQICLSRKSVRTYDEALDVPKDLREKIKTFLRDDSKMVGPFKNRIQIDFIHKQGVTGKISSYGFVVGPSYFLLGRITPESPENPHINIDYGFVFERVLLYVTELGLATVPLGIFQPSTFASDIDLQPNEKLKTITPVGYPKAVRSMRENVTKALAGGRYREPFARLFFKGLNVARDGLSGPEESGPLAKALEAMWWAPSATNSQPWRVFLDTHPAAAKTTVHFFAAKKIDYKVGVGMGIANFVLVAKKTLGLKGDVVVLPPTEVPALVSSSDSLVYLASWIEK